jgi:hypothetical protein
MSAGLFRVVDQGKQLKVNSMALLARCRNATGYNVELTLPDPPPAPGDNELTLVKVNQFGGLHFNQRDMLAWGITIEPAGPAEKWLIRMRRDDGTNLREDSVTKRMEVEDLYLVIAYDWDVV